MASENENGDRTLQKIEDMMDYTIPELDKFPKTEKGYRGIATIIREIMDEMAKRCLDIKKCYYGKSVLKELNELDKQIAYGKFYVKLAYRRKLWTYKKFEMVNDYLEQIGKMTGSWISKVMEAEAKHGKK